MTLSEFVLRIGIALLLGSLIGAERQWRNKLAGLKTNALVCVGAALFTSIGYMTIPSQVDVTRIISQIASGIGFLGAGAIIKDGLTIRGLTTAATIWCAAAIGSMAGAGFLLYAVVGTGFIFTCNLLLKRFTSLLFKNQSIDSVTSSTVFLNFYTSVEELTERNNILEFFESQQLAVKSVNIEPSQGHILWKLEYQHEQVHDDNFNAEKLAKSFLEKFQTHLNWKLV